MDSKLRKKILCLAHPTELGINIGFKSGEVNLDGFSISKIVDLVFFRSFIFDISFLIGSNVS